MKPVCTYCNDTHKMHIEDRGDFMCTRCPTPCQACRAYGTGAFCHATSCVCRCHRRVTDTRIADLKLCLLRAIDRWQTDQDVIDQFDASEIILALNQTAVTVALRATEDDD